MKLKSFLTTVSITMCSLTIFAQTDFTQYVNPFIGTGGHGHTFPGACAPFGLVQLSPNTDTEGWDWSSGYHYSDSSLKGFSHTHLSGTGVGDLGDILLMPRTGKLYLKPGTKKDKAESFRTPFSHNDEKAYPGYYSVLMRETGVKAELTATERCGFHQYTFPKSDSAYIILDPNSGIGNNQTPWVEIRVENDSTISGMRLSFGWVPFQYVYFTATFSKPFSNYQLTRDNRKPNWKAKEITTNWAIGSFHFETAENEQIKVKVGISTTSIENAKLNLSQEIPDWDFKAIVNQTNAKWNAELSKIDIVADQKVKEIFYSGLYHTMIQPNNMADVNGDYRDVKQNISNTPSKEYYSTFSLWDTYRAAHPLYTLINPKKNTAFVNTMIQHQEKQGFLPIWTLWGSENFCMIANHSIPVIVDAYFKQMSGIDYEKAYQAIKETSLNNHRGSYWTDYNHYGYYPFDKFPSESVSKTLEVSFNDWCVAQMAKAMGKTDDYNFFINRAQNYTNLFDASTKFFRARSSDSTWMTPFNPINIMHAHGYTEANAWQYYWYVPQDIPKLIELTGGVKAFEAKLDSLFTMSSAVEGDLSDVTGFIGQYVHGNEPSHHIAYLYNYIGKPWKTQQMLHKIINEMYRNQPDGYAGNEDCGQMSAWYILNALGFYPVNPAIGVYDIGSPIIKSATIKLDNGKTFNIDVKNQNAQNIYIQSAMLNGKPFNEVTISHETILKGGTLTFVMGNKPNKKWGVQ